MRISMFWTHFYSLKNSGVEFSRCEFHGKLLDNQKDWAIQEQAVLGGNFHVECAFYYNFGNIIILISVNIVTMVFILLW